MSICYLLFNQTTITALYMKHSVESINTGDTLVHTVAHVGPQHCSFCLCVVSNSVSRSAADTNAKEQHATTRHAISERRAAPLACDRKEAESVMTCAILLNLPLVNPSRRVTSYKLR
eukprot:scaffold40644_cov29-Prasinocladus_malaysianus.AAC.1